MTKVGTIEVPLSVLDEAAQGMVSTLQRKVASLEKKLKSQESDLAKYKQRAEAYSHFRNLAKDAFDLYDDYYDDL